MKITFPHLGNAYLGAKALLDGLEIDYVIPPFSNKKGLEVGSLYSPEEMCLPYKIMIGNYIQAIEEGANTIILPGSCGPCRFGEYCELQINLLEEIGHDINFIVLDYPQDIGIKEFFNRINRVLSNSKKGKYEKFNVLLDAVKVTGLIDEIESKVHYISGYEKHSGESKKLLKSCKEDLLSCNKPKEMITLLNDYKKKIEKIEIDISKDPIKIAIIGEIYTIIEPFSNLYIEDKLMDYGVSIKRTLSLSWWMKNAILSPLKLNSKEIKKAGKNYLPYNIGGYGRECIGEAVLAYEEEYDGAIQIFPMGCMPEIVSKSILPSISKDKDFPIMSLVVDEMTGEAGYITRIEAFVDLLERRRMDVLFRN